jgi:hypothetical protein
MDFLKKYNSENGQSDNSGVISKKLFYSRALQKGENIGKFLATVFDDGQKLKLTDAEIVDFLFSKGTLPDQWDSFMDGIKLNDHYRKNWFNLREALLDHGIGKGYTNATYKLITVGLKVLPTQVRELDSASKNLTYPSLSSEVVSLTLASGLVLFVIFLTWLAFVGDGLR